MKIKKIIKKNECIDILMISLVLLLAYGLLSPFLHYYIDDWYWTWTWNIYGHEGITQYFSTNRPVWGLLYQLTLPVLSINPLIAQIFSFCMRLITTILFLMLMRQLWPDNRSANLFAALVFGLYPGFSLQSIAITYSHIFVILSIFILSLLGTIQWINKKKRKFLFISLLLSFINVLTLEYFFTLELIRLVIIGILLSKQHKDIRQILKQSMLRYIPYFSILGIAVVIRTTLLTQIQSNRYNISFLTNFKNQPLSTMINLISKILTDFYTTTFGAWQPALEKIIGLQTINRTIIVFIALCAVFVMLTLFYFHVIKKSENEKTSRHNYKLLILGLSGIFFAGWPFWITNLEVTPYYLLSRYTLPFLFGVSIIYGFVFTLFSKHKIINSVLITFTLFTSIFYQMLIMNDFRIETMQNKEMMWQFHWRIPDLKEDTLVLTTDYPNKYYDVASLATELAVIYPIENDEITLPYFMLYSRNINEDFEGGLQQGIEIKKDNVTAQFVGTTSQMIAIDYDPGKCVRLLDPDLDGVDTNLHEHVRKAAQLSDLSLIDLNAKNDGIAMYYFGKEPFNSWCYYFEKADLAKQKQNWAEVIRLYDQATAHGFVFKSERERYPFIEAYAHLGQWDQAYTLIEESDQTELALGICHLTDRIDKTTPDSKEKAQFISSISSTMDCK